MYGRLRTMMRSAWKRRVSLRLVSLKLSNVYDGRFRSELPLDISPDRVGARDRLALVVDELRHAKGRTVILRGHDFRLRESPRDALSNSSPKIVRRTQPPSSSSAYVALRTHSHYSFLHSTLSPEAIVQLAVRHGMSGVGPSDHGNLHGAVEFLLAARNAGIKPILGAELRVGDQPLMVYVESQRGYHNFCRLLSRHAEQANASSVANGQLKPLKRDEIAAHAEGLIAVSTDDRLKDLFPKSFYPLVSRRETTDRFAVACPSIHYAESSHRDRYDIVQSIRTLTLLREAHPRKRGGRLHRGV